MNYYSFYGEEYNDYGVFSSFTKYIFSSPKDGFSLKKNHKRILFTIVALYLAYRLSQFLYNLFTSLYNWATRSPVEEPQYVPLVEKSRITRFFESIFVLFFGLAIGAVAYYAQQQQVSSIGAALTEAYNKAIHLIVYHLVGFDLTKYTHNSPNEALLFGTLVAAFALYTMYNMIRFLLHHYIFGMGLVFLGLFLFFYQFPITANTAATYSGTMFIIDRHHKIAYLVPSLIPKVLLTVTICYYLVLMLLRSFILFLRMSLQIVFFLLIGTLLLHTLATLSDQSESPNTSTTFTPNYRS